MSTWTGCVMPIGDFFEWPLEGREGVNLLRYDPGGFYKPHVDKADLPAWPPASRRAFTVVLFLESSRDADPVGGFSGGLLRLFPEAAEPVDIVPRRGMLVAFPAETVHEVSPVVGWSPRYGCRLVLVIRHHRSPIHDRRHRRG